MNIVKSLYSNSLRLEAYPFKRELSMEAFLIENEEILVLDDDELSEVEILTDELHIDEGRCDRNTNGRIDILAKYSESYFAVVELKLGELNASHLKQLESYLEKASEILCKARTLNLISDQDITLKCIGVLIGSSIDAGLAKILRDGYSYKDMPVAAITLARFKEPHSGHVYTTTESYFKFANRDRTQFTFDGRTLGKGKLVLSVIKAYVAKNPSVTFDQLKDAFPSSCHGGKNVFDVIDKARDIFDRTGHKRHFLADEQVIRLAGDCSITVCNQWGGDMAPFINQSKLHGFNITVT